jgi:YHS domain-containing protein
MRSPQRISGVAFAGLASAVLFGAAAPGDHIYMPSGGMYSQPCVPNSRNFGHFERQWRRWPHEHRPEISFPQSIGREKLPRPEGVQRLPEPEPEPREPAALDGATPEQQIDRPQRPVQPGLPGTLPGLEPERPDGQPDPGGGALPGPDSEPGMGLPGIGIPPGSGSRLPTDQTLPGAADDGADDGSQEPKETPAEEPSGLPGGLPDLPGLPGLPGESRAPTRKSPITAHGPQQAVRPEPVADVDPLAISARASTPDSPAPIAGESAARGADLTGQRPRRSASELNRPAIETQRQRPLARSPLPSPTLYADVSVPATGNDAAEIRLVENSEEPRSPVPQAGSEIDDTGPAPTGRQQIELIAPTVSTDDSMVFRRTHYAELSMAVDATGKSSQTGVKMASALEEVRAAQTADKSTAPGSPPWQAPPAISESSNPERLEAGPFAASQGVAEATQNETATSTPVVDKSQAPVPSTTAPKIVDGGGPPETDGPAERVHTPAPAADDTPPGAEETATHTSGASEAQKAEESPAADSQKAGLVNPTDPIEVDEGSSGYHRFRGAHRAVRINNPWVLRGSASEDSDSGGVRLTASWEPESEQIELPDEPEAPGSVMVTDLPAVLDGYCPVELVDFERWIKGSPRWTVVHDGRAYQLSGPAQNESFLNNPARYTPVAGGFDPVIATDEHREAQGSTAHCLIYQDRLYMFSSAESVAKFRENPRRYAEGRGTAGN